MFQVHSVCRIFNAPAKIQCAVWEASLRSVGKWKETENCWKKMCVEIPSTTQYHWYNIHADFPTQFSRAERKVLASVFFIIEPICLLSWFSSAWLNFPSFLKKRIRISREYVSLVREWCVIRNIKCEFSDNLFGSNTLMLTIKNLFHVDRAKISVQKKKQKMFSAWRHASIWVRFSQWLFARKKVTSNVNLAVIYVLRD